MSVLAGCGHKSEWICQECAACSVCCHCGLDPIQVVHINTKEAAIALARWAKKKRDEYLKDKPEAI
jgi:Na+-translocating ferredoxin:NAD+ oxidoreductase RnfC subunit